MKVHVFGEVLSAKNFDYDDLHVYYQLELPRSNQLAYKSSISAQILYQALSTCLDWHIDPSAPISGFTQTSRTKVEGNDEIAYFAHPFEFDLYYKNDENIAEHTDLMPQMPRLLFEVASYDSWNRYRTEGYAWTQLPVKSSKSLHWI